jgi:hypothetical protein
MSSGPWGIVVVRVSWPAHPTKNKKKKKKKHPFIAVDFSTDYAEFDSKYQLLYWCI